MIAACLTAIMILLFFGKLEEHTDYCGFDSAFRSW